MPEYEMSATGLAQMLGEALADHKIEDIPETVSVDDTEGDDNTAEFRVGWGGADLFDIIIKRV
jgi:hypothetical protein